MVTQRRQLSVLSRREYTDLYKDFLREFEDKMTDFIEGQGGTVEEFYAELRSAEDNSDMDIFAQIMNATIDFDASVALILAVTLTLCTTNN